MGMQYPLFFLLGLGGGMSRGPTEAPWVAFHKAWIYFIPLNVSVCGKILWKRNGNPLWYSRLENPTDRSLMGHSPWGHEGLDMIERTRTTCGNGPVRLFSLGLFSGFSVVFISRSGEVAEELHSSTSSSKSAVVHR